MGMGFDLSGLFPDPLAGRNRVLCVACISIGLLQIKSVKKGRRGPAVPNRAAVRRRAEPCRTASCRAVSHRAVSCRVVSCMGVSVSSRSRRSPGPQPAPLSTALEAPHVSPG